MNYDKLRSVSHGSNENSAAFQLRLEEILHKYTNLEFEARKGQILSVF